MTPQPLESRVDALETRVTHLEQHVGPVDSSETQVLPLRTEMRGGFSALRVEMAEQGKTLRAEMAEQGQGLRAEMAEQGKALRAEIAEQRQSLDGKIDGLSTQMRVLHEDVIERIALSQEARPRRPRKT